MISEQSANGQMTIDSTSASDWSCQKDWCPGSCQAPLLSLCTALTAVLSTIDVNHKGVRPTADEGSLLAVFLFAPRPKFSEGMEWSNQLMIHRVHWGTLCTSYPLGLSIWARDLSHLKPSRCSALVYLIKKSKNLAESAGFKMFQDVSRCPPSSTQSTAFILHLIII